MILVPPPPRPVQELRAGHRLVAGKGFATVLPDIDFETYSPAGFVWSDETENWVGPPGAPKNQKGLGVVGACNSLAHPDAEILTLAYDLKDGWGKRFWRPGLPLPLDLFAHIEAGGLIEAWNVGYERWCWTHICHPRMGWPAVQPWQWRCAMAKARAFGLPGSLEMAGRVLRAELQKNTTAGAVAKTFWMPRKPTKADPRTRRLPLWEAPAPLLLEPVPKGLPKEVGAALRAAHKQATVEHQQAVADHDDTVTLGVYNIDDIQAEAEISAVVPDITGDELAWWQVDQAINTRGVHVDRPGLENCAAVLREALTRYNDELQHLTGIDSASKVQQLQGWLRARGVYLESLDEENVEAALAGPIADPTARRVLEIRAAIGSASVKKVFAMLNAAGADDRLHDLFIYHGARTGRCTGDGPQPTNLPKAGPSLYKCACGRYFGAQRMTCPWDNQFIAPGTKRLEWSWEATEQALEVLASRSLQWVEHVFGDALLTISGVLRGLFDAAPGHDLISTDYSSIEAIGLAMLAGEQWRIDVFRGHGKIYEASASAAFKVPLEEFWEYRKRTGQHHELRQKGKGLELGCGYQGWLGAAKQFGVPGTDEEIKQAILAWRDASPSIVHIWGGQGRRSWSRDWKTEYFGTEGAAVRALLEPHREFRVERLDGSDSGLAFESFGGKLYLTLPSGRVLTYHSPTLRPSDRGPGYALSYWGWNTNPKNGPKGWIEMRTWGGRLVENWNQAICRDILAPACIALERNGYPVVLHVYDEIVSEIPEGFGSLEEFERIVTTLPSWASDWPVKAPDGWRAKRYRKG